MLYSDRQTTECSTQISYVIYKSMLKEFYHYNVTLACVQTLLAEGRLCDSRVYLFFFSTLRHNAVMKFNTELYMK